MLITDRGDDDDIDKFNYLFLMIKMKTLMVMIINIKLMTVIPIRIVTEIIIPFSALLYLIHFFLSIHVLSFVLHHLFIIHLSIHTY